MPDLVNGLFELFGFVAICLSIRRVLKDKQVAGISKITVFFFTSWGLWNTYYYPHLGQVISSIGAYATCLANCLWLGLLVKYRNKT